jgi:predicted PurR-regulated permease PerM
MNISKQAVDVALVAEHPTRNRLLAGILLLLVLHTCAVASVLIVPLLLALLVSLTLSPAVRMLCRWRLPRAVSVVVVMFCALLLAGSLLGSLVGPARDWVAKVPTSLTRIEVALRALRSPLQAATQAGEQLAKLADLDGESHLQRVVDAGPSQIAQMLFAAPGVLASALATLLLIAIFLLHGDGLLRKLVELAPALHLKKDIVLATRSAQHDLSTYMITISIINSLLGLVTAAALWWLRVPDPLLWGGLAALLNFVPFVGPAATVCLLIVVGFAQSSNVLIALSVPGAFLLLHLIEGQLLTPLIVGRRLALDSVMVFLALMLFGWLWGVAGLLLAMPLLTCLRIIAERVPAWTTLARLLAA